MHSAELRDTCPVRVGWIYASHDQEDATVYSSMDGSTNLLDWFQVGSTGPIVGSWQFIDMVSPDDETRSYRATESR